MAKFKESLIIYLNFLKGLKAFNKLCSSSRIISNCNFKMLIYVLNLDSLQVNEGPKYQKINSY